MTRVNNKKISFVLIMVLLSLLVLGGIAAGIYYAVMIKSCSGVVLDADSGEPIANVAITDGRQIVRTDTNGRYELNTWDKAHFITLSIPSGYWTEDFYIPLEKSGDDYNFTLSKLDTDYTNHTFMQVTDTEIGSEGCGPWLDQVKDDVNKTNPAFLIHTGDICGINGLKAHIKEMNTETMGVPVRYTIGNHDYVKYGAYGEKLYEELYGPVAYSFEVGDIHYIVTPLCFGDAPSYYTRSDVGVWLQNELNNVDPNKKVIIFNHDSPRDSDKGEIVYKYGLNTIHLKDNGVIAWIFGHLHHSQINMIDGVLSMTVSSTGFGGIDSSPAAYRTINITGNELKDSYTTYVGGGDGVSQQGYVWQTQLNGRCLFGDPVVDGDRIYAATIDDSYPTKPEVACIDAKTGDRIWSMTPTNCITNNMELKDGKLLFQDSEGLVYCLNAENGETIWKEDNWLPYTRHVMGSIVLDGDKVYSGDSYKLVCRDINTGKEIWSNKMSMQNAGERSPYRLKIVDDQLVVSALWRSVYACDKNSGKKLWSIKKETRFVTNNPCYNDGKLIFVSEQDGGEFSLIELDSKSGKLLRNKTIPHFEVDGKDFKIVVKTSAKLVAVDKILYLPTSNLGMLAVDLDTLDPIWSYKTGRALVYASPYAKDDDATVTSTPTFIDDNIIFGGADGYVYVLNKNTGKLISKFNIGSAILNKVEVVDNNKLVVLDFSGKATLLSYDNGKLYDLPPTLTE